MVFNLERNRTAEASNIRQDLVNVEATGEHEETLRLGEPDTALPLILSDRAGMMISPAQNVEGSGADARDVLGHDADEAFAARRGRHAQRGERDPGAECGAWPCVGVASRRRAGGPDRRAGVPDRAFRRRLRDRERAPASTSGSRRSGCLRRARPSLVCGALGEILKMEIPVAVETAPTSEAVDVMAKRMVEEDDVMAILPPDA